MTSTLTIQEHRAASPRNKLRRWLFKGMSDERPEAHHQDKWWRVMCLTGVDYFSTLGYQPGIAFLAAGLLSPLATLVLVAVTLIGALPVYRMVAKSSPHGQGSIAMLERLLPGWFGKALILTLLGFAATDFIITITLSAADATAHIVENPLLKSCPPWMLDRIGVTTLLIGILGGIFLLGFREAIGVSVLVVALYLFLNAIVLGESLRHLLSAPELFSQWHQKLTIQHGSPWMMIGVSLLLFPKLALGMSGFETGVAVMPLVKGDKDGAPDDIEGRVKNTRKLLFFAAIIMSVFLIVSSLTTTLLIPDKAFLEGGEANGRAISYLSHLYLGHTFGSIYDVSSILILWFAGASAMAGLLNLVPRYLPRFGMAPDWARAVRPLVLFFSAVAFAVTLIFRADVDAQAGAYATGVLVLMTSAAFAVFLSVRQQFKWKSKAFFLITLLFIYTSVMNMIERPEGLHIASFFIGAILIVSFISRAIRSVELRIGEVTLDPVAQKYIAESVAKTGGITLLAHRPNGLRYSFKEDETRKIHKLTHEEAEFIFLEVELSDSSDFVGDRLMVRGEEVDGVRVLRCSSPAIPNAIAALLLHLRDQTGILPHAYFGWTEGNPLRYVFKFVFLGEGETAPLTREILRQIERDPSRRPRILVG
ncbi:MAG: amino acid transporter [Candidatus Melainabacteria bacterium]|nr:MAG: amino acid transporter [Candidatus Melainabacteria bacterium]